MVGISNVLKLKRAVGYGNDLYVGVEHLADDDRAKLVFRTSDCAPTAKDVV